MSKIKCLFPSLLCLFFAVSIHQKQVASQTILEYVWRGQLATGDGYLYTGHDLQIGIHSINPETGEVVEQLASMEIEHYVKQLIYEDDSLFVVTNAGLLSIDVTNKHNPSIADIDIIEIDYVTDGAYQDGYFYIIQREVFHVYDVSDPYNIIPISSIDLNIDQDDFPPQLISISVDNDWVVVLRNVNHSPSGLQIINVSDPHTPYSFLNSSSASNTVILDNKIVYMTETCCRLGVAFGMGLIDENNTNFLENIEYTGVYTLQDTDRRSIAIDYGGAYSYFGTDNGLHILDTTNKSNPTLVSYHLEGLEVWDVSPMGQHLYVSTNEGVHVVPRPSIYDVYDYAVFMPMIRMGQ